uniref:Ammonium transporter n=1 Tax=Botryococcus braunii TaxID=38881 RepID=A0A218NGP0_BOTBR|nr:ammonium transporter [Botryococcus braunii]
MSAPGPAPRLSWRNINETIESHIAGTGITTNDLNASFTLSSAYLVFFMHCGFAMLSVGSVRARFSKNICILILVDACASAIGFYFLGYAFAFGDDPESPNKFIGTKFFVMSGLPALDAAAMPQYYQWLFQWSFAATACTIVSGAIAERTRFPVYVVYSFFMAAWVYPIVVHSVWSPFGWASMARSTGSLLAGTGAIDFAGSGAVHMVGGFAAAVGALIVGPRIGRFLPDGTVIDMPGHNASLFVLGVMILWFGWYGFNPGSQQAMTAGAMAAVSNAAVTTTLAPAAAGLAGVTFQAIRSYRATGKPVYDVMAMGNGALAGLVGITSACSTVYPWAALIIGAVAGVLYCIGSTVSVRIKLDDPLDAVAVHAWNGLWGVIAVGFFASKDLIVQSYGPVLLTDADPVPERKGGLFMGGGGNLLGAQVIYAAWIAVWVVGMMFPFWFILNKFGLMRVLPDDEVLGLDDSQHGGSAYPGGPEEASDRSLSAARTAPTLQQYQQLKTELEALKKTLAI